MRKVIQIEVLVDDNGCLHTKDRLVGASDLGLLARATWLLHRRIDELGVQVAIREHEMRMAAKS